MRIAPVTLMMLATLGCSSYQPARFAPRPPIVDAHDESPIPVPEWRWVPEPVYLTEIYLHRPLREAMDLAPYPDASDVNSFDEVTRSSWFAPPRLDVGAMARGPDAGGPPVPPFTVLPDVPLGFSSNAFSIMDTRGQRYEIMVDSADRPEMHTGAAAIAARLVWGLGLPTPSVFVLKVSLDDFWRGEGSNKEVPALLRSGPPPVRGYYRVAALAWPTGIQIGLAPESGTRGDDPNDVVPHEDRRLLRALKVFASWIELEGLGPRKTVDRYVGSPGQGHVVHYFVGLDDALGAGNVVRVSDLPPPESGGTPFQRLITLGLSPNPPPHPTQIEMPALGQFDSDVNPATFGPSLPYEPADRMLPDDGYWAAKRIAAFSRAHIALAIDAGKIGDPRVQLAMQTALEARRAKIIAYWFAAVTPIELVSVVGTKMTLRDEAARYGIVRPDITDYRVDFLTARGRPAADPVFMHPRDGKLALVLPDGALVAARDYLVVQIRGRRGKRMLPRGFEVHVKVMGDRPVVLGMRH